MSLIVGLTGGLATGKTFVAHEFQELGAETIDADKIAHSLLSKNLDCFRKIQEAFGPGVISNGKIERKQLGQIVFQDACKLKILEDILHPLVKEEIYRRVREFSQCRKDGIIVLDVPLLFETGLDEMADITVLVTAEQAQQVERAVNKLNISEQEAENRIKAQMPLTEKIRLADIIIDNSETQLKTKTEVNAIWQKLQKKIKK